MGISVCGLGRLKDCWPVAESELETGLGRGVLEITERLVMTKSRKCPQESRTDGTFLTKDQTGCVFFLINENNQ